jgi:hypothetical protein
MRRGLRFGRAADTGACEAPCLRDELVARVKRRSRWVLLIGAILSLAGATSASAHFNSGQYTHNGCPGLDTNRVDPLNIVFYNWGTWGRVTDSLQWHMGWTNDGGTTQYFVDHSSCYQMITQRASGSVTSSRFHVRLHPIHFDNVLGWTTVGDAHHEDIVTGFSGCWPAGHAVDSNGSQGSGFDQGRQQIRVALQNGGHSWYSNFWGNTQNFKQCDSDWARSDGYTVFVNMHQAFHY